MNKFGFSLSQKVATRNVESTPMLRALGGTTTGKFKLNGKGSELLMLAPGQHICFINNKDAIMAAVAAKDPDIMQWAEDNNTSPARYPVTYGVAVGFPLFDATGEEVLVKDRITKAESEALIAAGEVDEDGKAIAPMVPAFYGSKVATNIASTAIGCNLTFSDNVHWSELRLDAEQNQHTAWKIDEEAVEVEVDNGYESVAVSAFILKEAEIEDMER